MLRLIIIILIMLNAFMFYTFIWTQSGALHLMEIRGSYEKLEKDNQALVEENKRLSRNIVALRDDENYIEVAIRREMRYVKDNEVIYFFTQDRTP
jgi:cell division protein FtsB